tara:strand:+ start:204 stop:3353 length:3150 start_codon:yes stop_codon:yes gene_type:complete
MKKKILKEIKKFKKTSKSLSTVQVATQLNAVGQSATRLSKNIRHNTNITMNYALNPMAPFALVFNVAPWKRSYIRNYLSEYKLIFVGLNEDLENYRHLVRFTSVVIIVWGRSVLAHIRDFSQNFELPIYHIEDGFVRSIGLGANHIAPMSICFDKSGLYYDASQPSDLEDLLNFYDFNNDKDLMLIAKESFSRMLESSINKYNLPDTNISKNIYGPKTSKRVLVIGQVEDDQSLIYGCRRLFSNLDLLKIAIAENKDAQVIYKRHPDVMLGKRQELSDIREISDYIEIINSNISLKDALNQVDHVYTMTSLAGFEALMQGIRVTTLGAPFYSGWGLTDDRFPIARRERSLSLLEVFAAAYILYPRYRSADTLGKSSLPQTIDYIIENTSNNLRLTAANGFDYLKFYNLKTNKRVDNKIITNLTFESLAVISDSLGALTVAEDISFSSDMKVTLITTRDNLANDERLTSTSRAMDDDKRVDITSIHKRYSVPLSKMEEETVLLASCIGDGLKSVLDEYFDGFLSEELRQHISIALGDFCYFDILRFLSMKEALDEFDVIVVRIENGAINQDVIQAINYYAKSIGKENRVFLSVNNYDMLTILKSVSNPLVKYSTQIKRENKITAAKFWYDINDADFHQDTLSKDILVCGNIQDNNYAYSPATKKILEVINKNINKETVFINSALTNDKFINEFKKDLLDNNLYSNTTVYRLTRTNYEEKYSEKFVSYSKFFSENLPNSIFEKLSPSVPSVLLDIIQGRIRAYCINLHSIMYFIADLYRMIDSVSVFYTSMERSLISRVTTIISNEKNVKTIGIQPQIISTSKRYAKPLVDEMGVIDERQEEIIEKMGFDISRAHRVGSINILDRLAAMEVLEPENKSYDIFFAMQHSAPKLILSLTDHLKKICLKHNLRLIVKPHPHQELPIYNIMRQKLAGIDNIKILTKESDTYKWVAESKIVIGLFSSVLLESAIFGKDVIVAHSDAIDDSVNLSSIGLAIGTDSEIGLEETIIDFIECKDKWKELQKSRQSYLSKNPQFLKPYSTQSLDSFIESFL